MPRLTSFSQGGISGTNITVAVPLLDLQTATVTTNANVYSRDSSSNWTSIAYTPNGTGFVATQGDGDNDARIYQYSLNTAYKLADPGQSINYVGEQALGSSAFDNANNFSAHYYTGFNWSNNGNNWSILARNTDELLIRASTSAYNLTGSAVDRGNTTLSSIAGSVDDVFFNADNTKMYIAIRSSFTPSNHLRIREYDITNFESATTDVPSPAATHTEYTTWTSTTSARVESVYCCRWSNSGHYLCVLTLGSMHLFYTDTPFDMANMDKTALSSVDQALIGFDTLCFDWWGDDTGLSGLGFNGRPYDLEF